MWVIIVVNICTILSLFRQKQRERCRSFASPGQRCFRQLQGIIHVRGFSSFIRPSIAEDTRRRYFVQELKGLEALLPECLRQSSWLVDLNSNWMTKSLLTFCSALRLRSRISSYLDAPGLCAEQATAPESYSPKAAAALSWISFLWIIWRWPRLLLPILCSLFDLKRHSLRWRLWKCGVWLRSTALKPRINWLPGLMWSWRLQTLLTIERTRTKLPNWRKRLNGTTINSLQDFKVRGTMLDTTLVINVGE